MSEVALLMRVFRTQPAVRVIGNTAAMLTEVAEEMVRQECCRDHLMFSVGEREMH